MDHHRRTPEPHVFISQFEVLHTFTNAINVKIAEAIEIKLKNPFINVKYNEYSNILNLYK